MALDMRDPGPLWTPRAILVLALAVGFLSGALFAFIGCWRG